MVQSQTVDDKDIIWTVKRQESKGHGEKGERMTYRGRTVVGGVGWDKLRRSLAKRRRRRGELLEEVEEKEKKSYCWRVRKRYSGKAVFDLPPGGGSWNR